MSGANSTFDISGPIDHGPWTGRGKSVALMVALAIVFDGLNNQLLGLAAPAISSELGLSKSAFAQIIAGGMAGMGFGAIFGGLVGDRIGRRLASLLSIAVFGLATAAMGLGETPGSLMALRFAVGLGLGGLIPNGTALIAEFTPLRVRSAAVMLAMTCVPVGGILAGVIAAAQMGTLGWRVMFLIAGLGAGVLALILALFLPESPRYLVQHPGRHRRLGALLERLSIDTQGRTAFVDGRQPMVRANMATLFRAPYRKETLALCGAFFFCQLSSYSFLSWLPATLSQLGLTYAMVGLATAVFNFGGIVGAVAGAAAINRIGSRRPMLAFCIVAVIGALLLMYAKVVADVSPWALAICLALLSAALGVVQTALYPLAVNMFPAQVRTTGAGVASAVGRVGALVSSFSGAFALELGGARFFFASVALVMGLCGVFLFLIRSHTPKAAPGETPHPAETTVALETPSP